jgi:integrase
MFAKLEEKADSKTEKRFKLPLLLLAETGMRFKDLYNLKKQNFIVENGKHYLSYTMSKTGKPQKKPLGMTVM